jgi:hypothetical protein
LGSWRLAHRSVAPYAMNGRVTMDVFGLPDLRG